MTSHRSEQRELLYRNKKHIEIQKADFNDKFYILLYTDLPGMFWREMANNTIQYNGKFIALKIEEYEIEYIYMRCEEKYKDKLFAVQFNKEKQVYK